MEDVWSGPREEGFDSDIYIKWRVEGTEGVAKGTIGWPTRRSLDAAYASTETTGGKWVEPTWDTMWFPHAFIGVMEQLQYAVEDGHGAGARRSPTTSRPWRWSRPATARWTKAAPVQARREIAI